jgi:hypothetical protein
VGGARPAIRCSRRMRPAAPGLPVVGSREPGVLSRGELYGDPLPAAGVVYETAIGVRTGRDEAVVAGLEGTDRGFSERECDGPWRSHALVPEAVAGFRRMPSTG